MRTLWRLYTPNKERTKFKRIKFNRIVSRNIKGVKRFY